MRWNTPLQPATFVQRENRFRATVELEARQVAAHVANSGRLRELLIPGASVWVRLAPSNTARKTECDLVLVKHGGNLVSVDARLPNHLVLEALAQGNLSPFESYTQVRPETQVGDSRLDFLLSTGDDVSSGQQCWLETKSVTLIEEGIALFPDAPTARGLRHLRELGQLQRQGHRVAVLFVIQRQDALGFAPHPTAHPDFAAELRSVFAAGVEIYAWRCAVSLSGIELAEAVPVFLGDTDTGKTE